MSDASECPFCGHPTYRPDGHADWCARVAAWLRSHVHGRAGGLASAAARKAAVK